MAKSEGFYIFSQPAISSSRAGQGRCLRRRLILLEVKSDEEMGSHLVAAVGLDGFLRWMRDKQRFKGEVPEVRRYFHSR
jgi:hypothetical protein